jgi:hypothetical protein
MTTLANAHADFLLTIDPLQSHAFGVNWPSVRLHNPVKSGITE